MTFDEIKSRLPDRSYWETLPDSDAPLLLYGSGNGADKIIDSCQKYKIKIDGIFASDGFVRERTFHGMPVLSYSQAVETYGEDMTVLVCFGTTRDEVMDFMSILDSRHNVIIPEVPLYGGGIFDSTHLAEVEQELRQVYSMLSDDTSRQLFSDVLHFRMTGKLRYLKLCQTAEASMAEILGKKSITCALDGGAFKGDSARDMMAALPHLEHIIACEPDPSTFKKLSAFADESNGVVEPVMKALGAEAYTSSYVSSGSRGSGQSGRNRRAKTIEIAVDMVDSIAKGRKIDFLKLDVEGSEAEALLGAAETVKRCRPAMSVSLYHRTDDVLQLPIKVSEMTGKCKMYLRRPLCIPMWDLNLYVIPE